MTRYDNFDLSRDDGIAWITIDSETKMNSLNTGLVEELMDLAIEIPTEENVRCIVLQGTDDVFTTGGDVPSFEDDAEFIRRVRREASLLHDAIVQLKQGETPIVTGINGIAIGAGNALALSGDYTLMHEDAYLQYGYSGVGLTGDGSATFYLPRHVGLQEAKRIALLNERIDAEEAAELGLVSETVATEEFDDRLTEVAQQIASGPTKALGRIMRLLEGSYARELPEHLATETEMIARTAETEDFAEGIAAFKEGREPDFSGR